MISSLLFANIVIAVGCSQLSLDAHVPLNLVDSILSIGEVQRSVISHIRKSETLQFRQLCKAARSLFDEHRPAFVIGNPKTIRKVHPGSALNLYRDWDSRPSFGNELLFMDCGPSGSFELSMQKHGMLRVFIREETLENISAIPRSFWERFHRLELFVSNVERLRLLSPIFQGLRYDLVLELTLATDGHLDELLGAAKSIKSIKLFGKALFDLWAPHVGKTDMVFTMFPLTDTRADEVGGFLAERVSNGHVVWICEDYYPQLLPYLSYIHAFHMRWYFGGTDIHPDVLSKFDQLEFIRLSKDSEISLDEFLASANPDIAHTLTKFTADGFNHVELFSDASVRILNSVASLTLQNCGNADLRFLSQLPYLADLTVTTSVPRTVRLPAALAASKIHLSNTLHVIDPVTLTAESIHINYFHPAMHFENTKYLTITAIPDGSMRDLLARLPKTVKRLKIEASLTDDDLETLAGLRSMFSPAIQLKGQEPYRSLRLMKIAPK